MSLMQVLYDTYENNIGDGNGFNGLAPLFYQSQNAALDVTIDINGNFCGASIVDEKSMDTLIPVTGKSSRRAGNMIEPHALFDNLMYVAGDLDDYGGKTKSSAGVTSYELYMKQLKDWVEFPNVPKKIKAIYTYLDKCCLTRDLIDSSILKLDEDGKLKKQKINKKYSIESVVVRFIVLDESVEHRVWCDSDVIKNYIAFTEKYIFEHEDEYPVKLDFLTGLFVPSSGFYPKGILPSEYGAKLISSNDKSNYTYRGRFSDSRQVANLGYESSHKTHAALSWLVKNQGVFVGGNQGGRYYVYWSPNPRVKMSKLSRKVIQGSSLNEQQEKSFRHMLLNIKDNLSVSDSIVILCVEAPTTGQLSVVDYYEFNGKSLIDQLLVWNGQCSWLYRRHGEIVIDSPSLYDIAEVVYGVERQDEKGHVRLVVNDKLLRNTVTRLQNCLLTKRAFPYDLVKVLVTKVSNLQRYDIKHRFRVLSTACAVIRKYNYDMGKEAVDMVLDKSSTNRSYLFGRLLAVYDQIERVVLYKSGSERETSAMRLQQIYSQHPNKVLMRLDNLSSPYLGRLSSKSRNYYKSLIAEIIGLFNDGDFDKKCGLDENYLLGYYLQRDALMKKKENKDSETEDTV